jgi:hypothetical protein
VAGPLVALRPLMPGSGPENWFQGADKLFHLSYFALLWCLGARARLTSNAWLGASLLLFGAGIELGQGALTATRSGSFGDVLSDAAGLLVGTSVTRALSARQP